MYIIMDIKKLRTDLNMTQTELAKKVGASLSSVRLWENGVTTPTDKNMEKLIKALKIK